MIEINSYLEELDKYLILQDIEKQKIDKSIEFIKKNFWGIFQERLHSIKVFGSYSKDTFIKQDSSSDVDLLVTFKQKEFQPETYLKQIKALATNVYPRSDIYPDHPTIVIHLEHVRFEIVPSIFISVEEVRIPAPRTKELKWISSYPLRIEKKLIEKDNNNKGLIKPVIRIVKYWNYLNKKPFASFDIEKAIVNYSYSCKDLKEYFFSASFSLNEIANTDEQKKFVALMTDKRKRLKVLESNKLIEYINPELASILPMC